MYPIVAEGDVPGADCLNFSESDCRGDCAHCGYYRNPLRDSLARLGVRTD